MKEFINVKVEKKANIYFDGSVISRNITFHDGTIKSLGVMMPGEYEFNTHSKEIMEIISGKLEYQILNQTGWTLITDEMSFDVPAKSSFKVRVIQISHYCCSYIE